MADAKMNAPNNFVTGLLIIGVVVGAVWFWKKGITGEGGTGEGGSGAHAFAVGARVNLTIPEGVFPGTVSRLVHVG